MLGKGGLLGANQAQNAQRDVVADLPLKQRLRLAVVPAGGGAFAPVGALASAAATSTGSTPGYTGGGHGGGGSTPRPEANPL